MPRASSVAPLIVSAKVGCAWMVADHRLRVDLGRLRERELRDQIGDGRADQVRADEGAASRRDRSPSRSRSVSPAASAFASARNGNRPTLIGMPAAFAFSSVRPQLAISGAQYVHAGIVAYGTGSACTPAIISATNTPSADATCARPRPIDVADRPQVRAAAVLRVDLDVAALEHHAVRLEAEVLGVRLACRPRRAACPPRG